MSDLTPVKNKLIPAGAQMMSAWLVNDALQDKMKLKCVIKPCSLRTRPDGGDAKEQAPIDEVPHVDASAVATIQEGYRNAVPPGAMLQEVERRMSKSLQAALAGGLELL